MQCLARDPRQAPERFLALISSICTTALGKSVGGRALKVKPKNVKASGFPAQWLACGKRSGATSAIGATTMIRRIRPSRLRGYYAEV